MGKCNSKKNIFEFAKRNDLSSKLSKEILDRLDMGGDENTVYELFKEYNLFDKAFHDLSSLNQFGDFWDSFI